MRDASLIVRNRTASTVVCTTQRRGADEVATAVLEPNHSFDAGRPGRPGMWVGFSLRHGGRSHPVAATVAYDAVAEARLVQAHVDIGVVPRRSPGEPLAILNRSGAPVRCEVQQAGGTALAASELAPEARWEPGTPGPRGLWIGFFRPDGIPIASTCAYHDVGLVELLSHEPEYMVTLLPRHR